MTELDTVVNAYHALVDCREIVLDLLAKSRKGKIFHGTVFLKQPLEKAKSLLTEAKTELDDLTIVSLVSVFERIIFDHPNSSLRKKQVRQ
ncbi:MAG: hypothetical protein VST67_01625, partial [Nitrospirota bacterium]|nr:hypothetical protein [Nitrospirota bacterium]